MNTISRAKQLLKDSEVIYKELWSHLSFATREYTIRNYTAFEPLDLSVFSVIQSKINAHSTAK